MLFADSRMCGKVLFADSRCDLILENGEVYAAVFLMLREMGEGREVVGAAVLHYEDAAGFEQVGAEDGGGDIGDAFELIWRVGEDEIKMASASVEVTTVMAAP